MCIVTDLVWLNQLFFSLSILIDSGNVLPTVLIRICHLGMNMVSLVLPRVKNAQITTNRSGRSGASIALHANFACIVELSLRK
ncbi:hypothetical protein VNO77_17192 [Canavalia gladiata]|uniref:Secreted protein n=1 Tax=Canavalia gladiata TaxID=3824 RepID=A0AAN9LIR4_CANGL